MTEEAVAVEDTLKYATQPENDVYHLVELQTTVTLCGLPTSCSSHLALGLFVTNTRPAHSKLCRHCDDAVDRRRGSSLTN